VSSHAVRFGNVVPRKVIIVTIKSFDQYIVMIPAHLLVRWFGHKSRDAGDIFIFVLDVPAVLAPYITKWH
jgi:hypothetical protein